MLRPDGVTGESIQKQLTDALDKAIQLIYSMSITCKDTTPWDMIRRWENLIEYAEKEGLE